VNFEKDYNKLKDIKKEGSLARRKNTFEKKYSLPGFFGLFGSRVNPAGRPGHGSTQQVSRV
jgi:hypothetical protein